MPFFNKSDFLVKVLVGLNYPINALNFLKCLIEL